MFSRKREERPKRNHSGRNLAQYGLFEVPSNLSFDEEADGNDDDSDLEAELLALTSDSKPKAKPKPKRKPVPEVDLDAMIANSMKDIGSDEELSGDDEDPELLDELKDLTISDLNEEPNPEPEPEPAARQTVDIRTVLEQRLQMYITAEENAKKTAETSRARRFNRGVKTLKDLIKQANAGKPINDEDIPPEVSINAANRPAPPPTLPPEEAASNPEPEPIFDPVPEPVSDKSPVNQELLTMLTQRKDQYKLAAVQTKRAGDIPTAVNYMKIAKQFDAVIKAVENGEQVDLSQMPGPPGEAATSAPAPSPPKKEESESQGYAENPVEEEEQEVQLITAGSVGEALEQRLQVYKSQEEAAKTEGNSSKARRMGRIVKQYEQAIKQHKAGKTIPVDELPTPPGYAPIPVNPPSATAAPSPSPAHPAPTAAAPDPSPARPAPAAPGPSPARPAPAPPQPAADSAPKPPPRGLPRQSSTRKMGNQVSNTHLEKQVALLLARQKEFKNAAYQAKIKGEISQARELLRTAKGFDRVIDAARGGFPVDMDSLPIPASSRSILDESFDVVLAEECKEDDTGTLEMLSRLEEQLTKQLKMCLSTRDHHKALGDVTGVNRFENLALAVTRDLDIVRLAYRNSDVIPKFHYENKTFSIVKCCTDLNDNDVELIVVRGVNYNCPNPKDVDTYVKIEFPFPQEEPYKERTTVIKDTNNPEYNASFTIPIQRSSRACLRVFKRHSVKLEVYSRGCCICDWASCFSGFFRSDTLIGTAAIKLQPLETQCELHDSFDLMEGRKKVGGKLEVKIRVRHPMANRQVEELNEKDNTDGCNNGLPNLSVNSPFPFAVQFGTNLQDAPSRPIGQMAINRIVEAEGALQD